MNARHFLFAVLALTLLAKGVPVLPEVHATHQPQLTACATVAHGHAAHDTSCHDATPTSTSDAPNCQLNCDLLAAPGLPTAIAHAATHFKPVMIPGSITLPLSPTPPPDHRPPIA